MGTIPQWLTAIGLTGVLAAYWRRDVQIRGLQNADKADQRDHYAEELSSLRKQIIDMGQHHLTREREIDDRWRKLLKESEERHEECVRQREELRQQVIEIDDRLKGTIRQFLQFQESVANVITPSGGGNLG